MKKSTRRLAAGGAACALAMGLFTIGAAENGVFQPAFQSISTVLNSVSITRNGGYVAVADENYALADGTEVPYSILYQGTTYLPVRKVAELIGKDVTWQGEARNIEISDPVIPPLEQVCDTVSQYFPMPHGNQLSEEEVAARYGLDASLLESYCIRPPFFNISASEISIARVKDSKDIETVKAAFQQQKGNTVASFEHYLPSQYEIAKAGIVGVQGNYVYLIIHQNAAQVETVMKGLLAAVDLSEAKDQAKTASVETCTGLPLAEENPVSVGEPNYETPEQQELANQLAGK